MLVEVKEIEGELYVPMKTVGEMMKTVWPFPPASGPTPWTAKEEREYQLQQRRGWEESPL